MGFDGPERNAEGVRAVVRLETWRQGHSVLLTQRLQSALLDDEAGDLLDTSTSLQVREKKGACASHALRVGCHDREIRANEWREVDLVDDQQIRARDAGTALARNLFAARDINHINSQVGELRTEGCRKVVATGLDEAQLRMREAAAHLFDRGEIHGGIFANCSMGTAACLHAHDALRGQCLRSRQNELVFLCVDVIRNHEEVVLIPEPFAERLDERRFSRAHRATDSDAQGAMQGRIHERNNLVY